MSAGTVTAAPTTDARRHHDVGLLTVTTVVIGVSNYAMSLAVVRWLPAQQFTEFVAVQGLLLVLGTGSLAAVPWAVARHLATSADDHGQRTGLHFGLVSSVLQGLVLAVVATVVCWVLDGPVIGGIAGVGALLISVMAAPIGFFQGLGRFRVLVALRCIETGVRIGVSLALVLLVARRADLALLGFPIGSAVAIAYALYRARGVFPLERMERARSRDLVRQAMVLGAIQALLAGLAALDTVYADAAGFLPATGAAYQSAALVARIPLFFSSAVSIAAFTGLVAARDEAAAGAGLRSCLRSYVWLTVPFLLASLTVPASIVQRFVPAEYSDTVPVLRILCISGACIGAINVVTTGHQARMAYRACLVVLAVAVCAQAAVLLAVGATGDVLAFAAGGTAVSVVTLAVLLVDARRWLTWPRFALRWEAAVVVAGVAAAPFVRPTAGWIAVVAVVGLVCAATALRSRPSPLTLPDPTPV